MEVDCHLARGKIQRGVNKTFPVATTYQLADIFTKVLREASFCKLVSILKMINICVSPISASSSQCYVSKQDSKHAVQVLRGSVKSSKLKMITKEENR